MLYGEYLYLRSQGNLWISIFLRISTGKEHSGLREHTDCLYKLSGFGTMLRDVGHGREGPIADG